MKKVVISGATSFLGKYLTENLLSKGYFVYALVRNKEVALQNFSMAANLKIIEFDFSNPMEIFQTVDGADCFVNLAWDSSQGRNNKACQEKNIDNSLKMLELCRKINCKKFIYSGSQAEYGIIEGLVDESAACNPISEYGKAKLKFGEIGEEYARQNGIDFIHLRIFSIYGYGDRPNTLVDYCIKSFMQGEKALLGRCDNKWNYLYIRDFVKIMEKIIDSEIKTCIINIAGNETRTMRNFVKEIYAVMNQNGSYVFEDGHINAEKSPDLNPDVSKMLGIVGDFEFTAFGEGIKRTAGLY